VSDLSFLYLPESTIMFKNRILLEKKSDGVRTPEFIADYLRGIRGIENIEIVSGEVGIIYFTTTDMIDYGDESSAGIFEKIIKSELNKVLVWPSKYNVRKRDKGTLTVRFSTIGSIKSSIEKINLSIYNNSKALQSVYDNIVQSKLISMVKNETGDSIAIDEIFVVDSVTLAKIYDWTTIKDMYVYVDKASIIGV
jgi:hypothetical protein